MVYFMPQSMHSRPDDGVVIRDSWIFAGLSALLVWAPLPLGSNRTWAIGILIVWASVLLLGVLFAWRSVAHSAFVRMERFRWPLLLLLAFNALLWFQTLPLPESWLAVLSPEALRVQQGVTVPRLTLDLYQTRLFASLSFVYFACFLVAILTVRDRRRLDRLALILVASGVFQAVLGVLLYSLGADYRLFYSQVTHAIPIGTYINRNHFAGYLVMCLSIGIGLMLARLGKSGSGSPENWRERLARMLAFLLSPKMRLRLMLVVMVIALVLTRSRMGNSAFFASMLIVGLLAIIRARRAAPATVALIVSLVVIDVAVIGSWVGLEKVVERVQGTSLLTESRGRQESVEKREEAARYALPLIADFPLFGTGGGTFFTSYFRYRSPRMGYFDHAHNDYIEIAADCGLLGVGLLLLLMGLTAARAIQVLWQRRSSLPRGIAFGVLMAIVALAIHSLVDFNLQIPANALTFVVILAMGWVAADLPRSNRRRPVAVAAELERGVS